MRKNTVASKFLGILSFLPITLFMACDVGVGLGESVDTSAPTVEIAYPPIAATIRDTFTLYGNWNDDKGISSIKVSIIDTATKEIKASKSAVINADKTWKIDLNEFNSETGKYELLDGTYQISVTAYDDAGHSSGETSRTFDIDNTAPVFVISNPGVVKSQDAEPSAYGSLFTIEGTIADDHTIALMDVKIYSEDGACVSSETYDGEQIPFYREEEIPTAGGSSVIIAQHANDGDTSATNSRYSQMYSGTESTQNFYAEISLTDSAKIYKNPNGNERSAAESKNDSLGNSTSKVYLYDDVYTSLMSAKKGMGLSAADLKNLLNGTKTDNPEALEALKSSAKDTAASEGDRLSFSLNPDASPKYQVNGFSYEFDPEKPLQTASSGNSLTVTVSAGLDGTQVRPQGYDDNGKDSVKIWLRKYTERPASNSSSVSEDGVKSEIQALVGKVKALENDETTFGENETKINVGAENESKEWTLIYNYADHVGRGGSSVSNKTFSVTVPEGIELGEYYVLALTGCDMEDVAFSQDKVYGFEGNQQGVAPTLKIASPENLSTTKNPDIEFTGAATVNIGNIYVKELVAKLTVTNEETGKTVGSVDATLTCTTRNKSDGSTDYVWSSHDDTNAAFTWNTTENTWTFRPSKLAGFANIKAKDSDMYLYTLDLQGKSSSGHTSNASASVHIDKKFPAISISSAEPRVESYAPLGDALKDKYIYLNGTVTIKGSIEEQNLHEVSYDIWASTDLNKELSEDDSIFKMAESNSAIKAALENAGLDKSLGKVYSISQEFKTSLISNLFATSETRDQMIKVEVVLMAEDTAGNKTTYYASKDPILNGKTDTVDGKAFVIYQETDRPIITLENADSSVKSVSGINSETNLFGTTSNNRLQVSFEDDDKIHTIWVTIYDKDRIKLDADKTSYGLNPYQLPIGKSTYTLNYQLPSAEGTYQVRIDAFDSGTSFPTEVSGIDPYDHNIRSVQPFFIAVDSGAPQIKISSPDNESYTNQTGESGKFTLKGTVSKKLETQIECAVKDSSGNVVSSGYTFEAAIGEKNSSGTYDWTGSIILPSTDDLYTLTLTAIDTYSQKSSADIKLGLDTEKPSWNDDDFKVGGKAFASGANHTWYKSSTLQFEGKFAESGSGIDHVEYSVTKVGETESASDTFAPNTDGSFKQNLGEFIAKVTGGAATANKIKFFAVDKAGNKSEESEFDIFIDSEVPTVSSNQSGSQYSNKSNSITVTGTAEDDSSGVESVTLTVTEDGQTAVKTTVDATSTDSFATWTATIPSDFLSGLEDKTYAVKATVTDKAGNKSSAKLFSIDVDAEKPTIKNVSLSDEGGTYSVYETKESGSTVYYIHSGDNFLLSGSVQDSKSGIKSIVVNDGTNDIVSKINGKDVTALPVTLDLSNYASAGSVTLKITATDNAGNTESQNVLVKIDDIAPKALHAIDEKQKDVFFRINENDNDDIETLTEFDKDVGGKYAEGTYGNSKTIKIRGTLSDTGSGNSMIYYKVISETDLVGVSEADLQTKLNEKATAFLKNYKTDKTGYFAPGVIASDAKRRVFYTGQLKNADGESTSFSTTSGEYKDFVSNLGTLSESTKSYATVESNYNSVLSGFSTGKNYLILVAVDNVGNAALDSVKVGGTTYSNISLNVDETTPDASSSVEGLKYTNKKGTMEFSGTASDADSGLYSITLKQGTKEILLKNDAAGGTATNENGTLTIVKTDDKDNEWTWTATVKNDKFFEGASGTVSVSLEAKDCAGIGNTKSINVATVIVDEQLDNITLSAPTDADSETTGTQVNGTITLEGTMSDTNVLPTNAITRIEYKKTSDTAWTEASTTTMPNLALSGSYTFKVEGFDTTKLSDNTEYQIRAVGTDSAGNVKESGAVSVKVSQDSDRPKVNFNNIEYSETLKTFLLKHGTDSQVTGRISDDDATGTAVVKKFIVSETEYTGAEGETEPENLLGTSLSSSGEFTITPSDTDDGEKTFYIYIEDNGGKKFYTTYTSVSASATTNDKLQNPKILVKNTGYVEWDEKEFVYKSDSLNPTIGSGKGLPYSDAAAASVAKDFSGNEFGISSNNSNLNASFVVGGVDRRYVKFYFTGRDASGIASMSATFTLPDGNTETTSPTLSTGDSWTGTQNETLAEWTTNVVDTRKWGTGQVSVSVTITDRVGNATTGTYSFFADNGVPMISITKPVKDSHETQVVTISGTAFDAGNADVKSIEWAIPTKEQLSITSQDSLKDTLVWNSYMDTEKTVKSWEFVFDKATEDLTDEEKSSKIFKEANPLLDLFDNETYADATDGIYPLHIYFMATDKIGNFTVITDYTINHDPSGDRPQTTFSYPTTKDYADGQNYVTLGGTIRASGQSIIPIGDATVKEVYFQLVEETATSFTKDYVSGLKYTDSTGEHNAYTVVTAADILGTVYTSITSETDATEQAELLRKYGFSSVSDMKNWWGIKANGSASWNFTINEHDELNATGTTNNIKIRVCGVNSNNKFGAWSDTDNVIHIHVSSGVPQFTYTVAQFETAPTSVDATPSVVEAYSADMYLKGKWYIIVTATDDSQVKEMTATEGGSVVSGLVKGTESQKTVKMIIPVSEASGNHSYTVTAKDDNSNTSKMPFSINIDNAAPTLEGITGASVAFSTKVTNDIQNSNGMFTLAGESDDSSDGSGVKYVAFYYMRDTGTGTAAEITDAKDKVVFDPIHIDGDDSYSARVKMGDLVERKITNAENVAKVIKADKTTEEETQSLTEFSLWSKKLTGTMSAKDTFESSTALGSHIHVGGLIEIGGVYRKISAISGSTITLDKELVDATATEAYCPIAQIIDAANAQNSSKSGSGKFVFDEGKDDGDGMPESFTKSGSKRKWDASIYSDNMPDGPANLVLLVFDEAGNVNGVKYNVMVANNAPRIAKLHLGTDLDKNNEYSANEFETYNILGKSGSEQKVFEFATAGFAEYAQDAAGKWQENASAPARKAFIAKNGLAVCAEIVGGNGDVNLVFNNADTTTKTDGHQTADTVLSGTNRNDDILGRFWDLKGKLASDGANQKVSFTFWDSTEKTTSGKNSLYAFIRVTDLNVDQTDKVAPNVVVDPFFWEGEGEGKNSLYKGSKANGHIELEADLPADTFKATMTSGEYDLDPKVSGKIVLRGTAFDETLLKSLSFSMTDFDSSITTPIELATYTNGVWTNKKPNAIGTNSYEVTVTDEYLNQTGHKVNWKIAIDTAHLKDTTKLDAVFNVLANDDAATSHLSSDTANAASGRGEDGTTDATKHKPTYKMDVVPYITGIKTNVRSASGLKDNNIRSASGKYSILANKAENTITVNGFNFSTSNLVAKIANNAAAGGTTLTSTSGGIGLTASASDTNTVAISNSGITKSGYLEIFSNGIRTLNNINANDAHDAVGSGSAIGNAIADYANYYNREPDYYTTKNVQLTDDRYLLMWDMKDTGVENGYYPVMLMNGDNPVFGYVDNNGGPSSAVGTGAGTGAGSDHPTNAHAQRAEFNGSTGAEIYTEYLVKQLGTEQMGMAVDEGGRYYNATLFNYADGALALYYDRYNELAPSNSGDCWGPGTTYSNYNGKFAYTAGNNAVSLERVDYNGGLKLNRYEYPKLITSGDSTNGNAVVYMAYFDSKTNEILFRNFLIGTEIEAETNSGANPYTFTYYGPYGGNTVWYTNSVDFNDYYVYLDGQYHKLTRRVTSGGNGFYSISDYTGSKSFSSFVYSSDNEGAAVLTSAESTLDSTYGQKVNFLENISNSSIYNNGRLSVVTTGSKYFDMGVTSDKHVVIVYMDSSTNKLVLKYSTNAVDGSSPTTNVEWTTSAVSFPENVGTYVSMSLDGDSVHIAAFDSYDSNLVYMHLDSYAGTDLKSITVDQASAVGNWTQVKIKEHVPYIAYYNATETGSRDCIKLAYPVATKGATSAEDKTAVENALVAGVDVRPGTAYAASGSGGATGYTTGAWEYMTIPAMTPPQGGDPKFQNVCLGFDSNGRPVVGYLGTTIEFGKALDE
ncbi:Ig-like domain repeat protein [Treponema zioleckii]|uniref:Ig-like domain repeat protein n=1 Tax=Treponema zioleckii TaxID=331680 RepID=UPI00168C0825|nr:Ig-like domain repeat protein [Treponema zioleckii]